jgi:hypothetical protein
MEKPFSLEDVHGMTPDKLRTYPGLNNLSDDEADKAIFALYQLTALFFEIQPFENTYCIDSQLDVDLQEHKHAA